MGKFSFSDDTGRLKGALEASQHGFKLHKQERRILVVPKTTPATGPNNRGHTGQITIYYSMHISHAVSCLIFV
jgi:hypothetical protein